MRPNQVEQGFARYLGEEALARLGAVTLGVAGAGGLGSNCAACLVRCGFKRFVIADFDVVEPSNLNRQFFFARQIGMPKVRALAENLCAINPDLELTLHETRITPANANDLFQECDALVEALDAATDKALLADAWLPTGRLLVAVSGMGGYGRADAIATRRVRDAFFLIGDETSDTGLGHAPLAPGTAVAAAKQADVVLSHFLGRSPQGDHP